MATILLLLGLLSFDRAYAYPEFIGYKYASCLTCHYNGMGNGPLNDYGRALWANEIGGRALAFGRTDEQLAEASGIIGSKQLPWWIRPGLKGRGLYYRPSPGGDGEGRFILMQAEANMALFFDQDQKKAFVGSWGLAPIPQRLKGTEEEEDIDEYISREHYFRFQIREPLWLYLGMTDKVYGIRQVDHTAYARSRTGLAQNDQAHGLVVHYIQPEWELAFNGFMGNMFQKSDLRQKGASLMYEFDVKEAWRLGVSALVSANEYVGNRRFGIHSKRGYGHGSAVLAELGVINNVPISGEQAIGYYGFFEHIQRVKRGYHLFIAGHAYKERLESGKADNLRLNFGVLAFPFQRVEFRLELQAGRQISSESENVSGDAWAMLSQLHFSL